MEILYIVFGIIGGLLGGMGMGGGTLLIPLLTLGPNVPQQTAQLINLLSFIPMSVLALTVHIKNGYVVKDKLWAVIVPAIVTAVIGSMLAASLDAELLKKIFGGFLVLLGAAYLFNLFVQSSKNSKK